MDIRCRKTSCRFNDRYTCKANGICISQNVVCEQFIRGEEKGDDKTKRLFTETPPTYAPQRDSKTITIKCKAHCLFNKDGDCVANGITVNDLKNKPYCVTYLRK